MIKDLGAELDLLHTELEAALVGLQLVNNAIYDETDVKCDKQSDLAACRRAAIDYVRTAIMPALDMVEIFLNERVERLGNLAEACNK